MITRFPEHHFTEPPRPASSEAVEPKSPNPYVASGYQTGDLVWYDLGDGVKENTLILL
jgi:hypothetical protein